MVKITIASLAVIAAASQVTAAPVAIEERAFSLGGLSALGKLGKAAKVAKPASAAADVAGTAAKASKGSDILSKVGSIANVGFLGASLAPLVLGGSSSGTAASSSVAAPPPASTAVAAPPVAAAQPVAAASSSGGGFLSSIETGAKSLFGLKRDFTPEEEEVVQQVLAVRKRDLISANEEDLTEIHEALVERGFGGINLPGAAGNIKSILELGIKAIEQSKIKPRPIVRPPLPKALKRDVSDLTEEDIEAVHNVLVERGFFGINLPGAAGNIKSALELGATALSSATKPPPAAGLRITHPELFPATKPITAVPAVRPPFKLPKFL